MSPLAHICSTKEQETIDRHIAILKHLYNHAMRNWDGESVLAVYHEVMSDLRTNP
jgi:hypothetical protein